MYEMLVSSCCVVKLQILRPVEQCSVKQALIGESTNVTEPDVKCVAQFLILRWLIREQKANDLVLH